MIATDSRVMVADRRRHGRRAVRGALVMAIVCGLLGGYVAFRWRATGAHPLREAELAGTWIQAASGESYTGSFRCPVELSATVTNAWVAIAACDSFEITVNGNPVARHYLWRPTRPFQNGLSEAGQRFHHAETALGLVFPREYQWSGHDSYRLPVLVDIRRELRPGRNVICVQVESRRAPAKFCLGGEITLATEQRLDLTSTSQWKAEPVPPTHEWTDPDYDDRGWSNAHAAEPPAGPLWRSFAREVFSEPFRGDRLRHPAAPAGSELWFQGMWRIPDRPEEAWLRVWTDRPFDLFINGIRVAARRPVVPELDSGQWIMERQRGLDPQDRPTLLDPDELGSPFAGDDFETPPAGDPTRTDFRWLPNHVAELRMRPSRRPVTFTDRYAQVQGVELAAQGHREGWSFPDPVRPQSHRHDRHQECLVGYDVTRLLHAGDNRLEIRLSEPESLDSLRRVPSIALDGGARLAHSGRIHLGSGNDWQTRIRTGTWENPMIERLSLQRVATRPRLQYRGAAEFRSGMMTRCARSQLLAVGISLAGTVGLLWFAGRSVSASRRRQAVIEIGRCLGGLQLVFAAVLAGGILLCCGLAERHEALWFSQPNLWRDLLFVAALLAVFVTAVDGWVRQPGRTAIPGSESPWFSWRGLPKTRAWPLLVSAVMALGLFLRVYRLDFQPLDDDEYASAQAIMAIAEIGVPQFAADGVWYTRSPLFHYGMGALVALLGPNLWTLRLPCAVFGVLTCGLTYMFGSRLLKSPWVGLGAMLLVALHPYEVYTGHVIRFYQLQQLLALATLYCFCRGFVRDQSERYRYLTILAFLSMVLCQEASCVMGFSLLLAYLLFAVDKGWASGLKLMTVAACAVLIIVLDYAVFQTRCMTRLPGISPNLEAAVRPHFWHPYNFLSLLIGYSRLHVVGSVFLLLGLPLVCRERQRCTLALYVVLFSGIVMTNLWVTHNSLRYQYWLIPVWAILSMEGMRALLKRVCAFGLDAAAEPHRHGRWLAATSAIGLAACLLVFSPWRLPSSYDMKLLGDSTGALQFVRAHLRPEDRVMVTQPHTHAALVETGRADYDLAVPLLYDYAMLKEGRLIDRNAGAEVIGDLPHLAATLQEHDRVWIAVNHEKFRSRGQNVNWDYPGARVDQFLRRNCQLMHRTYLWSVYLWDGDRGRYVPFRADQL